MTNPKLQINLKSPHYAKASRGRQISNSKHFGFSIWSLFIVWFLVLGILPFSAFAADESIKDASDSFANLNQAGFLAILNYWMNIFMSLVGILTVVIMLYVAFLYMSAGTNEENAKKAKKFLIWGLVGAVVLILSFYIVSFTGSLLTP